MEQIAAAALAVLTLYAWGGICFLFFRFSKEETELRMRSFLEYHRSFFVGRRLGANQQSVNRQVVRNAGSRGWNFILLPLFSLWVHPRWNSWVILSSIGVLFFGGLMLAYSWYGLRCLRLLKLESFKVGPEESLPKLRSTEVVMSQNKKLFLFSASIVVVTIGGFFYVSSEVPNMLPSWVIYFEFTFCAIFLISFGGSLKIEDIRHLMLALF